MNQYYLMAQLPSLDGIGDSAPLPITEEEFFEVCARFLSPSGLKTLASLSAAPARDSQSDASPLVDAWNRGERQLRLALGSVRAARMKKTFDIGGEVLSAPLVQAATTAAGMDDPLAAEQYLNRYRLGFLEQLRPMDGFCEDAVFYYGLKLMLLARMRRFDTEKGKAAYQNMYDSILRGGSQENER